MIGGGSGFVMANGGRGLAGTALEEGEEEEEGEEAGDSGLGIEGGGREMATSDIMWVNISHRQFLLIILKNRQECSSLDPIS